MKWIWKELQDQLCRFNRLSSRKPNSIISNTIIPKPHSKLQTSPMLLFTVGRIPMGLRVVLLKILGLSPTLIKDSSHRKAFLALCISNKNNLSKQLLKWIINCDYSNNSLNFKSLKGPRRRHTKCIKWRLKINFSKANSRALMFNLSRIFWLRLNSNSRRNFICSKCNKISWAKMPWCSKI